MKKKQKKQFRYHLCLDSSWTLIGSGRNTLAVDIVQAPGHSDGPISSMIKDGCT